MSDLFDWTPPEPPEKYPDVPGHVRGSETSKEAADSMRSSASGLRAQVWSFILSMKAVGATCDEVEEALDMRHQTASARVTELGLSGDIEKTTEKRATRSGRNAAVYIAVVKK